MRLAALLSLAALPCAAQEPPKPLTFTTRPPADGLRIVVTGQAKRTAKARSLAPNVVPSPPLAQGWSGKRELILLKLKRGALVSGRIVDPGGPMHRAGTYEVERRGKAAKGTWTHERGTQKLRKRTAAEWFGRLDRAVELIRGLQESLPKAPVYPNKPLKASDALVRALCGVENARGKLKRRMDLLKVKGPVALADKRPGAELSFDVKVAYRTRGKAEVVARAKGTLRVELRTGRLRALSLSGGRNVLKKKKTKKGAPPQGTFTEETFAEETTWAYPAAAASDD